jgi:hypothetical protein
MQNTERVRIKYHARKNRERFSGELAKNDTAQGRLELTHTVCRELGIRSQRAGFDVVEAAYTILTELEA